MSAEFVGPPSPFERDDPDRFRQEPLPPVPFGPIIVPNLRIQVPELEQIPPLTISEGIFNPNRGRFKRKYMLVDYGATIATMRKREYGFTASIENPHLAIVTQRIFHSHDLTVWRDEQGIFLIHIMRKLLVKDESVK